MLIGSKLTRVVARALGCRFLGQHWPDTAVRWDGECFTANCRVCETELRRVGPGIWREFTPLQPPAVKPSDPCLQADTQFLPKANTTEAAQYIQEAITMLDELAPIDPYALAAITHAREALDLLNVDSQMSNQLKLYQIN